MTEHTFTYRWGRVKETITVENRTWNERVAKQYAANHILNNQTVDWSSFDVHDIEVEI